ncbi:MAG: hypothetical protein P8X79_13615 [Reinekea sp.]|jgi:hypothetical protein
MRAVKQHAFANAYSVWPYKTPEACNSALDNGWRLSLFVIPDNVTPKPKINTSMTMMSGLLLFLIIF